jgi:hypothetical protein
MTLTDGLSETDAAAISNMLKEVRGFTHATLQKGTTTAEIIDSDLCYIVRIYRPDQPIHRYTCIESNEALTYAIEQLNQ